MLQGKDATTSRLGIALKRPSMPIAHREMTPTPTQQRGVAPQQTLDLFGGNLSKSARHQRNFSGSLGRDYKSMSRVMINGGTDTKGVALVNDVIERKARFNQYKMDDKVTSIPLDLGPRQYSAGHQ